VQHAATEITAPDTDNLPAYWQFHEAVARAQLAAWLPAGRRVLVDVSQRDLTTSIIGEPARLPLARDPARTLGTAR